MRKIYKFGITYLKAKFRARKYNIYNAFESTKNINKIYDREFEDSERINQSIYDLIMSDAPCFIGRFGATELTAMRSVTFELKSKYKNTFEQMQKWSGFFGDGLKALRQFNDLMIESTKCLDILGIWFLQFEEFFVKTYTSKKIKTAFLFNLEPWTNPLNPWTAALKGKKILVIHPFSETIEKQYRKRELLFPNTNILPEFELKTLKAVQTIAGEKDERFNSWFDALEWMYEQALKSDFDVAIIGCGAYGFPLAAKLKNAGKKAVHLGGATQILFGIKGKRWETQPEHEYVRKFFNESWVYPSETDRPGKAEVVEGGCYW